MEQNVGGIKLSETMEKIIDFMVENKLIKPFASAAEKESVIENVKEALAGAFNNGNAPTALFNNPAQMKKLLLLVISAAVENNLKKDPSMAKVAGLFNTNELAKAMFSPEMNNELAKKTIFEFTMALRPPGPGSRKKCEDLAELLVQQKLTFGDRELHDLGADETLDNDLRRELQDYLYKQEEYKFMQAFGSSPDGTPITDIGAQQGNTISAEDRYVEEPTDSGYAKMDGLLDNLCKEMESTLRIASAPKPTPKG